MQRLTESKVRKRSHEWVLNAYRQTRKFPPAERFGLVSQLNRAALSVPTNFTWRSKRRSNQEYARFIQRAEASFAEAEYLVMVNRNVGLIEPTAWEGTLLELSPIDRMLNALQSKIEEGIKTA